MCINNCHFSFDYLKKTKKNYSCDFRPLTLTKLWFWPPKKKTTKPAPKFCNCSSIGPPRPIFGKKITCGTSLRVPRQHRPSQNWLWWPKLLHMQNLGGGFVVFFLRAKNATLGKSGAKVLFGLSLFWAYEK